MPCSDGCYSAPSVDERTRFARVTELLCEACQLLEANNILMTHMLSVWWLNHKEEDRKRIAREVAQAAIEKGKADALAKLTPYERKLLRLD